MAELTVVSSEGDRRQSFSKGMSVLDALGVDDTQIQSDCGGKGVCGLCRVVLVSGDARPPTPREHARLSAEQLRQGTRLACQLYPEGDVKIMVPAATPERLWRDLDALPVVGCAPSPRLAGGVGVAVDLGSTHIRVSAIDLGDGRRLAACSGINPQARFGTDVLTRLALAAQSDDRARRIGQAAVTAIGIGLHRILNASMLGGIRALAVVGNTAELTLLSGRHHADLLDPDNWSRHVDCQPEDVGPWRRGWSLPHAATIALVDSLAGFVGSDILAGIVATRLTEGPPGSVLVDFGTNTEIALWDGSKLWITAAAGGPAFEGSGISCGMPAEPGAIDSVDIAADTVSVIGGGQAFGICGSGLVDAIAGLAASGRIDKIGRIVNETERKGLVPCSGHPAVRIGPMDIDLFQRAKAAVGAGLSCLLDHCAMSERDIARLCVSGAFGQTLSVANAQAVGLLPGIPVGRVELCPDTALRGCEMMLISLEAASFAANLRRNATVLNFADSPAFEDRFIANLRLSRSS